MINATCATAGRVNLRLVPGGKQAMPADVVDMFRHRATAEKSTRTVKLTKGQLFEFRNARKAGYKGTALDYFNIGR